MRFLADENFNNQILVGLRKTIPGLDILRVQDTSAYQAPDPVLLEWAAKEGRILLTHDVQTMTKYTYDRVRDGLPMPGIIEVRSSIPIGQLIEELSIMIGASTPEEFDNQVKFVPIR